MHRAKEDVRLQLAEWIRENPAFDVVTMFHKNRRLFEELAGSSPRSGDDKDTMIWMELARRTRDGIARQLQAGDGVPPPIVTIRGFLSGGAPVPRRRPSV